MQTATGNCALWIMNYELWIMNYALCIMNYALWIVHYELCIMNYALWIMNYALWIMHYALWIMHYALWIMHYELWIMHYELCIMHYELWIQLTAPISIFQFPISNLLFLICLFGVDFHHCPTYLCPRVFEFFGDQQANEYFLWRKNNSWNSCDSWPKKIWDLSEAIHLLTRWLVDSKISVESV